MGEKLTWEEIKRRYREQWVELIEFDWDEWEPDPCGGIVRHNAQLRKELHDQFMKDPIDDSAIVYTGNMRIAEGTVFSANLHQYGVRK